MNRNASIYMGSYISNTKCVIYGGQSIIFNCMNINLIAMAGILFIDSGSSIYLSKLQFGVSVITKYTSVIH